MPSTVSPNLKFNQTAVRSGGAHTNATTQQPASGGTGGGTVNSVGAGTNVSIGGTATNPVVNVPNLAGDVTGAIATNTVALLSGVGSILQTPVGYATGGNIQVRFDLGSFAYIGLTVNASFSPSGSAGIAAGRVQTIDLTNTTGGTLTLTWNASWKLADGALPTSITAGSSYRIELRCGSTTEGSIIASWFQTGSGITQLTGDVTAGPGSGSQAATITAGAVTLAKMANLPAYSVMGNNTAGAAAPLALTEKQFRTMFFQQQFYVDDYITAAGGVVLTGINAAISDLNTATKGVLVFGPGTYAVAGAINAITASAYVKGCGWYITQLAQGNFDGLTFTSANPCTLRDMWISCGASNQCVVFGNAGTANSGSLVDSIQTTGGLAGISCWNTTNQFTISNCTLGCTHNILVGGYVNAGVVTTGVRSACIIQCNNIGGGSTNGIYALHPDGLSIQNNQIVSTTTAINMVFPNQSGRSDLWVVGNHIESADGLYMNTTNLTGATTSRFNNIVIVGNEFGTTASYGVHTDAHATTSPNFCLAHMVITGNVFTNCPLGPINIYSVYGGSIQGNLIQTNGSVDNIYIDSSCKYVRCDPSSNGLMLGTDTAFDGLGLGIFDMQDHTVAGLQQNSRMKGTTTWVSDSNQTLAAGIGAVVAGGGANVVPVFSDGTNWRIG